MKRNEGKYPIVQKLPAGAILVKEYAEQQGVRESALYNRVKRGTAEFQIVLYFGMNFIVPQGVAKT